MVSWHLSRQVTVFSQVCFWSIYLPFTCLPISHLSTHIPLFYPLQFNLQTLFVLQYIISQRLRAWSPSIFLSPVSGLPISYLSTYWSPVYPYFTCQPVSYLSTHLLPVYPLLSCPSVSPAAVKIKKPIQTKFRMPVLNWVALKPNQINGTVFNDIDDESILQVTDNKSQPARQSSGEKLTVLSYTLIHL